MQPGRRVADEWPQLLGVLKILVGHRPGVERLEIGKHGRQQAVLVIDDPVQALAKDGRVKQVGNPDAVDPAHLVAIAGPDPAEGRSQVIGRGRGLFGQPLLGQVVRQNHMRAVADVQPVAEIDSLCRQPIDLLEQGRGMDDHAVADDAVDPLAQNPGGHQRELVSHALVNDRVPRVRAPLVADDHVVLVAEQVDNLSLGLIAPLEAHDATRAHGIPLRSGRRPIACRLAL